MKKQGLPVKKKPGGASRVSHDPEPVARAVGNAPPEGTYEMTCDAITHCPWGKGQIVTDSEIAGTSADRDWLLSCGALKSVMPGSREVA